MSNEYQVKKVQPQTVQPKEIRKIGQKELKIVWSDSHASLYAFRNLRQNCQCALCVDECTGSPVLDGESVPKNIEGLKVNIVGQYALSIDFSDGHCTGIYVFRFLREICPCGECAQKKME